MTVEALRSSHAPGSAKRASPLPPETPSPLDASRRAENRRDAHVASYRGSTSYPAELFIALPKGTPSRHVEPLHVQNRPSHPVGARYTDSVHEVGAFQTKLSPEKMVALVSKHWPALGIP